jgi:hypothetical protein
MVSQKMTDVLGWKIWWGIRITLGLGIFIIIGFWLAQFFPS